jgi:hypothetical protein
MHDENDELALYQDALRRSGSDPDPLAGLAVEDGRAPAAG